MTHGPIPRRSARNTASAMKMSGSKLVRCRSTAMRICVGFSDSTRGQRSGVAEAALFGVLQRGYAFFSNNHRAAILGGIVSLGTTEGSRLR